MKAILLLFSLVLGSVAWVAVPETSRVGSPDLVVVLDDTASLSIAAGMANKCCGAAGNCYAGPMSQNNCKGPLPYQCYCNNTGAATWVVSEIKQDSICKETTQRANCEDGQEDACFRRSNGVCDDDGGGWSWLGACWVCGPGSLVLGAWEGTRKKCTGTACLNAVPVDGTGD